MADGAFAQVAGSAFAGEHGDGGVAAGLGGAPGRLQGVREGGDGTVLAVVDACERVAPGSC